MNERCFENIMKDQITLNKRQLGNIRDRLTLCEIIMVNS